MNLEVTEFVSPGTLKPLVKDPGSSTLLDEDKVIYPIINNLPILVQDPKIFLAQTFYLYQTHVDLQVKVADHIVQMFAEEPLRKNVALNLKQAILFNNALIEDMNNNIEGYFSPKELVTASFGEKGTFDYLKAFRYVKRDWCGLPEGETQLNIIKNAIGDVLSKYVVKQNVGLFLGAGAGRIMFDLLEHFDRIYATDKSYPMAYIYQTIFRKDYHFYDILTANLRFNQHSTRYQRAGFSFVGMQDAKINEARKKISYFLADVCQLPLKNKSMDTILSIYFTDVLPLKNYFGEIRRVLKDNGLFIHFGPLGYPFKQNAQMYAAEDIVALFYSYGFEILKDEIVPSFHMQQDGEMTSTYIDNWLFVARKCQNTFDAFNNFPDTSVLIRNQAVEYVISGSLPTTGEELNGSYRIRTADGKVIHNGEVIVDILKLVDGKRTANEIVTAFFESFAYEVSVTDVKELIVYLLTEHLVGCLK